ncbi:MAG: hypothetical protein ABI091_03910 [Ferruginibacter sp.]
MTIIRTKIALAIAGGSWERAWRKITESKTKGDDKIQNITGDAQKAVNKGQSEGTITIKE